ncbi:DUF4352 domain-containing protein [Enterococcus sp. DIV0660C]|uniref:DUF4352 domain-containing protein n=1 Tax=Enterococcus sp. DIV0660C TaxID=2230880 RepID=UPI001A907D8E|nr:DUF4352 domain-containing protein [Enterococcus sp. DIV0660C]MBO0432030.1 DUF4352 domain-containing protein [Enterococcus sp. DIV0660C]
MKKIGCFVALLGLSTLIAGCNSQNQQSESNTTKTSTSIQQSTEQSSSTSSNVKYLRGLEITLGDISTADNTKDTKIVSIKVKVRNRSNEEQGVGSNDFKLNIGKQSIEPYADGVNFGQAVLPEKSLEGVVSFEVKKDVDKGTLLYQKNEATQEWNIKF